MKKYLLFFILITQISFAQSTSARKVATETFELITKNSLKQLGQKSTHELIEAYTVYFLKNGLGKEIKIPNKAINSILEDVYKLRGKEDLIKVGQKLSSFNGRNINGIKGFIAEELHYNELLKIKGLKDIQVGNRYNASDFVQGKQLEFVVNNMGRNKDLYLHKLVEIDLMGSTKNNKFLIEVKNIDSPFSETRFLKYFSQIVKQKAFADENGIKYVFWSNIGTSLLTPNQVMQIEKAGVIVLQKGSTSPIINAKINMNRIKRELMSL